MRVRRLQLQGFRNLTDGEIAFHEGVNVIYGDNAQGKTNLLEAVWLFTGGRSFRGAKERELLSFSCTSSRLTMEFDAAGRAQQAALLIQNGRRTAALNGVERGSASSIIGEFCAVVFSPEHLSLIKAGPAERRKFIDAAICQIKPAYAGLISRYQHTLAQRNALLKDVVYHSELVDTLEIWEEKLASFGAAMTKERLTYTRRLQEKAVPLYAGIAGQKEQLSLTYRCSFEAGEKSDVYTLKEGLMKALFQNRREDIRTGATGCGPHRDDLELLLDNNSARSFGSQGQQRSCVLALKLSEASILQEVIGERPVVLLDDVMSELDLTRQDYILNHIEGFQVFITCCERDTARRLASGKSFLMQGGRLTETA